MDDTAPLVTRSLSGGTSRRADTKFIRPEASTPRSTDQLLGDFSMGSTYYWPPEMRVTAPVVKSAPKTSMLFDSTGFPM
jgi:hypothetical protein